MLTQRNVTRHGVISLLQVMYLPLPHHPVHLQLLPHQKTALETDDLQPRSRDCLQGRCLQCQLLVSD